MKNRTENGRILPKMMKSKVTSSVPRALGTHVVCHGCWRGGRGPSIDELEYKLCVSSTKSVVCIAWQKKAWTLTSMSSKFGLHDYTKVAFRLCHGLKCKKENWARSQPWTWRNKLFTSRNAENHDHESNHVLAKREPATTSSVMFFTNLPTYTQPKLCTSNPLGLLVGR
jgi:hypothetical protein